MENIRGFKASKTTAKRRFEAFTKKPGYFCRLF